MSAWKPAIVRPDGSRQELEISETVWITHFLPMCDDPQKRGREGSIPSLYPQGLLSLFLHEEGFSFREIAALLNRDLAHVKRMETRTREVLRNSMESRDSLASDIEHTEPQPGVEALESLQSFSRELRAVTENIGQGPYSIAELSGIVKTLFDITGQLNEITERVTGTRLSQLENPDDAA